MKSLGKKALQTEVGKNMAVGFAQGAKNAKDGISTASVSPLCNPIMDPCSIYQYHLHPTALILFYTQDNFDEAMPDCVGNARNARKDFKSTVSDGIKNAGDTSQKR